MSTRKALDIIEVKRPCPASWDAMVGDDRSRFCDHCQRDVYNLSAMPTDQAERLLCETGGNLCVRFEKAADGRVKTIDYHERFPLKRTWRVWALIGAGAAMVAGAMDVVLFFRKPPPAPPAKWIYLGSSM